MSALLATEQRLPPPSLPHQIDAFNVSKVEHQFALFMDQGTGKSRVTIDTAAYQFTRGEVDTLVVLAPAGVYRNWIEQVDIHLHPALKGQVAYWVADPRKAEAEMLARIIKAPKTRLNTMLMNIEACQTVRACLWMKEFLLKRKAMIVIDESTTVKHEDSQRSQYVRRLCEFAKWHRILSGTPAENSILHLYSQFDVMKSGMLGYHSFVAFRARYAKVLDKATYNKIVSRHPKWRSYKAEQIRAAALDPDIIKAMHRGAGQTYDVVINTRNEDELKEHLSKVSFIIKKEDCLGLAPKIYQKREVVMTASQRAAYKQMQHNSVVEIEEELSRKPLAQQVVEMEAFERDFEADELGEVSQGVTRLSTASIVLTKLIRLHQLACGIIKPDDGEPMAIEGRNPLIAGIMDQLEGHRGKALIFLDWRFNVKQLAEALRKEYGEDSTLEYHGGVSGDTKQANLKLFQDPLSPARFMIGTSSMAYGLTLTAATLTVFGSNLFDRERRTQAEDRTHRIGQTKSVLYVDMDVLNSIFQKVFGVLKGKKDVADMITASNWREWFT